MVISAFGRIAAGFITTTIGLILGLPALAADPGGFHDENTCTMVRGWTCDPDNYNAQLAVHFYRDGPAGSGTIIGSATANVPREAGVKQACGNGHNRHGFSWTIPASVVSNGSRIYVHAINASGTPGGNPVISDSGKSYVCANATTNLYLQPSLTTASAIKSRVIAGGSVTTSLNTTYYIFWGQGATAGKTALSWNAGVYTGFTPPSPVSYYQYGRNNSLAGSIAIQVYGRTAGIINAPQTAGIVPQTGLVVPTVLNHTFDRSITNIRPWQGTGNRELSYSVEVQIPRSTLVGGAVNYVQSYIIVWDVTSQKGFWIGNTVYDSRGASAFVDALLSEQCGTCNTGNPIISSYYGLGSGYTHAGPGTTYSQGAPWTGFRKFEYRMSRGELQQAITDIRARFPDKSNLSTNPDNYQLYGVYFLSEVYYPTAGSTSMGLSFRNLTVSQKY